MTNRLILGVDPGQTGAIAALADGVPAGFIDMPVYARKMGGNEVDPFALAVRVREIRERHPGAYVMAVLEQVNALPKQSSNSGFRFGQSDGIVRGVLGALGIRWIEVHPSVWKKRLGLAGTEKDVARTFAIQRYPEAAADLARKKDIGRADAALLATWAELAGQVAVRPAA